jgi:hypothetical protein
MGGERVSPAELIVNSDYKYIRNWCKSREKLEAANRFFEVMETRGLIEGAKAFPVVCPKKAYYHKDSQAYQIYFKRGIKPYSKTKSCVQSRPEEMGVP